MEGERATYNYIKADTLLYAKNLVIASWGARNLTHLFWLAGRMKPSLTEMIDRQEVEGKESPG
jgi:hypothetical protein